MFRKYNWLCFLIVVGIFVGWAGASNVSYEEKKRDKEANPSVYDQTKQVYRPGSLLIESAQLTEDFESGVFPPTGWSEYHSGVDALDQTTLRSHSPTHSALFDDVSGVDTSWLVTPQITALASGSNLSFWQSQNFSAWYEYHAIWVSTGSPDPAAGDYVEVIELGAGTEDTWEEIVVSLAAYAGQDIYIAFVYSGSFADEWYIDDVTVAPPAAHDIGVNAVFVNAFGVQGKPIPVSAIIQNFGTADESGFTVQLEVSDGHMDTYNYTGTLAVGEIDTITFPNSWIPASAGTFNLTAYTQLAGDGNPANDTASTSVDVIGTEVLNFEEDFAAYSGSPGSIGWFGADNKDFGTFIPSSTTDGSWTYDDFGNDPALTRSARFNFWGTTSTDMDWLITPPIDMTSRSGHQLIFDIAATAFTGTAHAFLPNEDTLFVVVSTDGVTWLRSNIIAMFTSDDSIPAAGMRMSYDLSAYSSETSLFIGFLAWDLPGPGDMNVYIDNVFVGTPPAADVGVTNVFTNAFPVQGSSIGISAVIRNFGTTDQSGFDVQLEVSDGFMDTYNYSGTLPGGEADTILFPNAWVPASADTFVLTAYTQLAGDANPANDTASTSVIVIGTEVLNFEEDFTAYSGSPSSIGWLGANDMDFGTFMPSFTTDGSWTYDDFGNDPALTRSARFNFYSTSLTDMDWLITPPIDMTSRSGHRLIFDIAATAFTGTAHAFLPNEDTLFVVVSTDGVTWLRSNIIAMFTSDDSIPAAGMRMSYDLSAYSSETSLFIGFLAWDLPGPGDMNVYIDNVFVGIPPALDVGPVALVAPQPGGCYSNAEPVIVQVQNFGANPIDFATNPMTVFVDISGASSQNFSTTVNSGMLDPDSTLDVTVTTNADLSNPGTHTFTIYTQLTGDANSTNDTLNVDIEVAPVVSLFPYTEDFETFKTGTPGVLKNGWRNVPGDDFDWYVDSAGTPSSGTGPNVDHTTGSSTGHYMFTESSSPNYPNKVAYLLSPCLDLSALANPQLEFWYHMYGATMGELHVDVYSSARAGWTLDVMPPIVGQQQTSGDDPWLRAVVDLSSFAGQTIAIRFRGITGSSFTSDMAIDDVTIREAPTTPIFAISPDSADFGTREIGDTSAFTTFTITNAGGGTLVLNPPISITGPDAADFVLVDTNSYPVNLNPGQSTTVDVAFAPQTAGAKSAFLTITDNTSEAVHDIPLIGVGTVPAPSGLTAISGNDGFIPLMWVSPLWPFEGFEEGIPTDWTVYNLGDDPTGQTWAATTVDAFEGNQSARCRYGGLTEFQDEWLISNRIAIDGTINQLHFFHRADFSADDNATNYILVSTTDTQVSSFTAIDSFPAGTLPSDWTEVIIDLSAYAGQNIYIAWQYRSTFGESWYIDAVSLRPVVRGEQMANVSVPVTLQPLSREKDKAFDAEEPAARQVRHFSTFKNRGNSPLEALQSFKIYRSTSPGVTPDPANLIGTVPADQFTFVDNTVTNFVNYYYIVTALWDEGESVPSNEARGAAYIMTTSIDNGFVSTVPTIDGVLSPGEWDDANFVYCTNASVGVGGRMWIKNDAQFLYFAFENQLDATMDNFDQVGIYFDTNNDGLWAADSTEGNYWIVWNAGAVEITFRPWLPDTTTGTELTDPPGVVAAISNTSGHMQYEVCIDLNQAHFSPLPGQTAGLWVYMLDNAGAGVFTGFWPEPSIFFLPETFGDMNMASGAFDMVFNSGWNLIGLPLMPADPYYLTLFPNAVPGTLFRFQSGGYTQDDTLDEGVGYWLRFTAPEVVPITGSPIDNLTLNLNTDWNLIAGVSCDIALADVTDPGGIIIPGTLFGFEAGGYSPSDSIKQGKGYWVRANASGPITLSCSSRGGSMLAKRLSELPDVSAYPSLKIADASGASQTLHFNVVLENPDWKLSYSLPPLPPAGAFDARFAGDYRISETDEALIQIQSSNYPVSIEAKNLPVAKEFQYVIQEIIPGKEGQLYPLKEGQTIQITNPQVKSVKLMRMEMIPLEFAVDQNYPNPFNPTTEIRYALPEAEKVEVVIYNTLGQKVKTLVSKYQEAGFYKVTWDGTNDSGQRVGSGIYFYRVSAGKHLAIKKMVLLK